MNEQELKQLILKVTAEVLKHEQVVTDQSQKNKQSKVVVLVAGPVPCAQEALCHLKKQCVEAPLFLTFGQNVQAPGAPAVQAEQLGTDNVLKLVENAEQIVLLAPTLTLLAELAEGKDELPAAYFVLHAALWGKQVKLLLDFFMARPQANPRQSKLAKQLEALQSMGIACGSYRTEAQPQPMETSLLVTEEQVTQSARAGKTVFYLSQGALVTPLAKDAAKELKLEFKVLGAV